jgi:hypothetical protein
MGRGRGEWHSGDVLTAVVQLFNHRGHRGSPRRKSKMRQRKLMSKISRIRVLNPLCSSVTSVVEKCTET